MNNLNHELPKPLKEVFKHVDRLKNEGIKVEIIPIPFEMTRESETPLEDILSKDLMQMHLESSKIDPKHWCKIRFHIKTQSDLSRVDFSAKLLMARYNISFDTGFWIEERIQEWEIDWSFDF